MFRNILVPLDGSPFAEGAIPLAARLAKSAQAHLHLVLAHQPLPVFAGVGELAAPPVELGEELRAQEEQYLTQTTATLLERGVANVAIHESDGLAGPELCEQAIRLHADLIVMATHGRGGIRRFWLGSVADYLVRHLSVPVLLVHPGREGEPREDDAMGGILVALDLSEEAEAILEPVTALALLTQAHVTLVHVVAPYRQTGPLAVPYPLLLEPSLVEGNRTECLQKLDAVATRLRERGLSVSCRMLDGMSPASALLDKLGDGQFDLIALATHGAGGVRRLMLGSVADQVIRRAAKPVLVLRPSPRVF